MTYTVFYTYTVFCDLYCTYTVFYDLYHVLYVCRTLWQKGSSVLLS